MVVIIMKYRINPVVSCFLLLLLVFLFSCRNTKKPPEKDIVVKPEQLEAHTRENIETLLAYAAENHLKINDSVTIQSFPLVRSVYRYKNYETIWSAAEHWKPLADSMFAMVEHIREYGL